MTDEEARKKTAEMLLAEKAARAQAGVPQKPRVFPERTPVRGKKQ